MSGEEWKFIVNLGDTDYIDNGGLFLYEKDGEFLLEKLEEPCDDDHCEECEEEPDLRAYDAIWDIDRACDKAFGEWCDERDNRIDVTPCSDEEFNLAQRANFEKFELQREAAKQAAKIAHEAWEKHVAEHERWTVYRIDLEQFKIVRQYDIDECVCVLPESVQGTLNAHAQKWWLAHSKVCPNRKVTRYLVPDSYEPSWRPASAADVEQPGSYEPWFYDKLDDVASCMDTTKVALIKALCSGDGKSLAWAWQAILDHHGWANGDSYPLMLSRPDVEERYKDVEE